jgi:hypothetical protein
MGFNSKNGLITLDGKDYFPKEYLDADKHNNVVSPVNELSDYLRRAVCVNANNGEDVEPQINVNRLNSEADSGSHSFRSDNGNMEEGKSLLEDFNLRSRVNLLFPPIQDIESPNNFQREAIPEDDEDLNVHSEPFFPPIQSEDSKVSNSNEYKKVRTLRMNHQDGLENLSQASKFHPNEETKYLRNKSLDLNSYKKSIQNNDINIRSKLAGKKSSPCLQKLAPNQIFEGSVKTPFLDQVFPFQEDFSIEHNHESMRELKKGKNSTKNVIASNFSKSANIFNKTGNAKQHKQSYQRSNTPEFKNTKVLFKTHLNRTNYWLTQDIMKVTEVFLRYILIF